MRKYIFLVMVSVLPAFLLGNATQNVYSLSNDKTKIYLNEDHIFLDKGKIYLAFNDISIQLPSLYSDDNGIYIAEKEGKWPWTPFICTRCGRPNPAYNFACSYCGEPRHD